VNEDIPRRDLSVHAVTSSTSKTDPYELILETARPEVVTEVRRALSDAGIPYRSGLLASEPPRIVFSVPRDQIERAREVLDSDADDEPPVDEGPARFPWREVSFVATLIALHLLLVAIDRLAAVSLLRNGGLAVGGTALEPWRLFTSLLLHTGPPHVLWNGASMLVFGVPLLHYLGLARTTMIYLAAGVGGGLASLAIGEAGTLIVGSSGAVAGLFGAWVIVTLHMARDRSLDWRARIRTWGIALLVLPSLVTPLTASGQRISVSSHLGGLATGMLIGVLISRGLLGRGRGQGNIES